MIDRVVSYRRTNITRLPIEIFLPKDWIKDIRSTIWNLKFEIAYKSHLQTLKSNRIFKILILHLYKNLILSLVNPKGPILSSGNMQNRISLKSYVLTSLVIFLGVCFFYLLWSFSYESILFCFVLSYLLEIQRICFFYYTFFFFMLCLLIF